MVGVKPATRSWDTLSVFENLVFLGHLADIKTDCRGRSIRVCVCGYKAIHRCQLTSLASV